MRTIRALLARLRGAPAAAEFDAEMEEHLRLLADRYVLQGMTPEDAALAARRQFGNSAILREDRRAMQTFPALEGVWRDLRHAVRMLARNRGFTAAVTLTLALGIGANMAIFSVCDAVLFKPLPYADPDRIVMLWEMPPLATEPGTVAPANFVDWRAQTRSYREMAAIDPFFNPILTGRGEPSRLSGVAVSSNFFRLLGTRMRLGRDFLEEEDRYGASSVVILSHSLWQQRFGGEMDICGRPVTLNDISYTVVGVLPKEFELVNQPSNEQFDIWTPLALNMEKLQRGTHPLRVFARLRPDVSHREAQAELDVVAANLARLYPDANKDEGILATPLLAHATTKVRIALVTLLGAVGLVLLIACTNVANLLLSRAAARQREMAVRLALGASRGRLARQLLTESVLLSLTGGAMGLAIATGALAVLTPLLPADLPRVSGIAINVRVLLFTGVISTATGILFGLAPLFESRRTSENESLKQSGRIAGGVPPRLRAALVVAQMAIALVLLSGAGLMAKSFWAMLDAPKGFHTGQILTARVSLPASRYPDARHFAAFQTAVLDRARHLPGVQSAGMTAYLPLSGTDNAWAFTIDGRPPLPVGVYISAKYRPVSEGYFETMGIPLVRGRSFTPADDVDAPFSVVISESMARLYWDGEDPIGQRLRFGGRTWRTIVGIAGDVRHERLDGKMKPEMYVPFAQAPSRLMQPTIVVRTAADPRAVTAALRAAVAAVDGALPVDRVATMEQLVSTSAAQPRFRTVLLGVFSVLALAMASIGIYGVMNYLVIQRTREFGVRLAVGATEGDLLRLVLGRAAALIAAGLGLGLIGSAMLARLIAGLLYGVSALDPPTFATVSLVLAGVALLASYLPAQRAARVDPVTALRYE